VGLHPAALVPWPCVPRHVVRVEAVEQLQSPSRHHPSRLVHCAAGRSGIPVRMQRAEEHLAVRCSAALCLGRHSGLARVAAALQHDRELRRADRAADRRPGRGASQVAGGHRARIAAPVSMDPQWDVPGSGGRGWLRGVRVGWLRNERIACYKGPRYAMFTNIVQRGVLSPLGHVVWTCIAAGAVWRVKGDKPFAFDMLKDRRCFAPILAVMALHATWNSQLPGLLPFFLGYLVLGGIAWTIAIGMLLGAMREIRATGGVRIE